MRRHLPRILRVLAGSYWALLFVLTHIPRGQGPDIGANDKIAHLLAYGVLTGALFAAAWATWPGTWWPALAAIPVVLLYGAVDEWLQAVPWVNRSCEMADWLADATGMTLALAVMALVRGIAEPRAVPQIEPRRGGKK